MQKSLTRIKVRGDVFFALPLLAVAALSMSGSNETTATPPTPVRVTSVGTFEGSGGIRYSANINAFTQVTLSFKSAGYAVTHLQHADTAVSSRALRDVVHVPSGFELESHLCEGIDVLRVTDS